jgi:tripartite-type tricarboxylate transporter receptor subunit TctC
MVLTHGDCRSRALSLVLSASALAFASQAGLAQTFPDKPVHIIVPVAAGGAADTVTRVLADHLALKWQQPVVIENRVGASGNVGAAYVAQSPADGYILLASPPPPLAINQFLFKSVAFKSSDLAIVTVMASAPNVLVAKSSLPVANVSELLTFAKLAPGKLNFASSGVGGTPHLTLEWMMSSADVRFGHVPYPKGISPAINDLLGGHVDLMFANLADVSPHVEAGTLKALGVTSAEPLSRLHGVQPVHRAVPGLVSETWFALAAPASTPEAVIAKIAADVSSTLTIPAVLERLRLLALTPVGSSPKDAAAYVANETKRWHTVIEKIGLKPS